MPVKPISFKETYVLRHSILRPGQLIETCYYVGDESEHTFHFGYFHRDELVGVASFYLEPHKEFTADKPYRLRGMATLPVVQRSGFGRKILLRGIEELKRRGADLLWCNAREGAFEFYKKMGLSFHGDLFEIPEIGPHQVMYLKL